MAGKAVSRSETWWKDAPTHVIRSTAPYKSNGLRCRREAYPGANVCTQHGALAPRAVQAAAVRIQMTADDAAKRLVAWTNDESVDMRERVKIAQDMLDRGGLTSTSKLLVGLAVDDPVEQLFRAILTDPGGLVTAEPVTAELSPVFAELNRAALDHDDIVEGKIVEEAPRLARIASPAAPERVSSTPPKHIREALERLL